MKCGYWRTANCRAAASGERVCPEAGVDAGVGFGGTSDGTWGRTAVRPTTSPAVEGGEPVGVVVFETKLPPSFSASWSRVGG